MKKLVAAGAACLCVAALTAAPRFSEAQTTGMWPTFHGDLTRDGISTLSGYQGTTAVNEYHIAQSIGLGTESSPVVDSNGDAYVGDEKGNVFKFTAAPASGPKWTFKAGAAVESTPSLSADGTKLFVGSNDGNVYALSTVDGHKLWSFQTPSEVHASPLVSKDGNSVYVPTVNGVLYSLKVSDGTVNWQFNPGVGAMPTSVAASPDGGTLYVVLGNQTIYGLPASGPTSSNANTTVYYLGDNGTSTPSVDANGNIYEGTQHGTVQSFAPANGTARWIYQVPDHSTVTSSPAFLNGNAIFGAGSKYVYAISESSGQQVWQTPTNGPINSSPAVTTGNNSVFIASDDGNYYVLDTTGKILAQRLLGGGIDSSPAIAPDGSVWLSTRGGLVYHFGAIQSPPTGLPTVGATAVPTGTVVPTATTAPVASATAVNTAVPTATPTPIALSLSVKKKVYPGSKEVIKVTSAPNTLVHLRIDYPNGDHQSHAVTTNASGTATYKFTQGASKITHRNRTATVTATAGTGDALNTQTAKYTIQYAKIDVSIEPRTRKVGKVVDIFVHTYRYTHVVVYILGPNRHVITRTGYAGKKGFASIKLKIPKGLVTSSKRRVIVLAKVRDQPRLATKSFFTVSK